MTPPPPLMSLVHFARAAGVSTNDARRAIERTSITLQRPRSNRLYIRAEDIPAAAAALIEDARTVPPEGYLYFMRAGPFVKIGFATDIRRRVAELQTGCPFELDLLCLIHGQPADELRLHSRFDHLRERKEWFRLEDDLRELIDVLLNSVNSALATIAAAAWLRNNPGLPPPELVDRETLDFSKMRKDRKA